MIAMALWLLATLALAADTPDIDSPLQTGVVADRDAAAVMWVSDYADLPDVPHAVRDATAIETTLEQTVGVSGRRVVRLSNGSAREMKSAVVDAAKRVKRGGTLWIYYAGHGISTEQGWVLLGSDAPRKLEEAAGSGFALDDLGRIAADSRAGRVIVILEAGFGGVGPNGGPIFSSRSVSDAQLPPVRSEKLAIWMATSEGEAAWDWPEAQHGLFTWLAVGAMRGWADGATGEAPDGQVTIGEARAYTSAMSRTLGRNQFPSAVGPSVANQWLLTSGELEEGPSMNTMREFAVQDRDRRFRDAEARLRGEALAAWEEVESLVEDGAPDSRELLADFVGSYERASVVVEWAVTVPELAAAKRLLFDSGGPPPTLMAASASSEAASSATETPAATEQPTPSETAGDGSADASTDPPPEEEPSGPKPPDTCDDLVALEPFALMGQLGEPLQTCLEERLEKESTQTVKDRISRVLLADAEGRADAESWGALARRHLEDIDRSDPNLCFKYSLYLYRQDAIANGLEVIRWADYALENKQVWSKATYKRRLYDLYRIRAETANKLWILSEQSYAKTRAEGDADESEKWRNSAKQYAREWLDYARASGQESQKAMSLCMSAAGTPSFCEGG